MVKAVVGANWGDEGKGKITDMLAEKADIIVRFQGGANAGHTIVNNYGKFALHTLPSGVFYDHTTSVIGNGVALNIPVFFKEYNEVVSRGVPAPKILISERAQMVMPYHILFDQYEEELEKIRTRKRNYTPWQVAIGAGFACGGFCIQFGCDWMAFLYASIAAIIGMRVRAKCNESGLNHYMGIAISAFIATMLAWASTLLPAEWTSTPWHPLLACALFIVPGVPLINFVDDMLDNYIQVGIVRAVNTLLMVSAMAFGIAFAVKLCSIGDFFPTISMVPHHNYLEYAIAAAISAMGFSMIFNIQRRLLWVVAIGGIIAVCTRNFVNLGPSTNNIGLDMGLVIGSFSGSVLVSLIAIKAVHWFHVPNHVLTIPSVIPMIPGVLMYRMLFGLINMNVQSIDQVTPLMKAIESGVNS